jgi:hypothetical protein
MVAPNDIDEAGPVCVNTGRLWAGGAATAIVAALAVVAGGRQFRGLVDRGVRPSGGWLRALGHWAAARAAPRRAPSPLVLRLDHRAGRCDRSGRAVHSARAAGEQDIHRHYQHRRRRGGDYPAVRSRAQRRPASGHVQFGPADTRSLTNLAAAPTLVGHLAIQVIRPASGPH